MPIRILIVDDATFIRDMVKKNLREKMPGVEVFDAVDGNRAVALLKAQQVDLILSDWEMPGMSGEELLRWVRGHDTYKSTPFIMVTSRGDRDHVLKAVQAGVSDYLSKPFTPDELLRKAHKQLQKIGKSPAASSGRVGSTQGVAMASVDALTGGASSPTVSAKGANDSSVAQETLSALTGAKVAPKKPAAAAKAAPAKPPQSATKKKPAKVSAKGKAQLRFPQGATTCVIRDISLQALSGLIPRSEALPTVFDQAAVDIEGEDGSNVARLNGYVHSIAAAEQKPDSNVVNIVIRFVDKDPEKFEFLSKYIAKVR